MAEPVVHPGLGDEEALEGFYGALLDDDAEALYERAPCGYLSTTPDGSIVKVNQTFLTLTGYRRQDLVGRKSFTQLLTAGGRIYHETHYAPMLQMQGRAREIALDLVRADGRRLPALVNAVLERDRDGVPVVIRVAVFDATERRQYERELLHAKEQAEESEARARVLVRTLQQSLVPPAAPRIGGLDVAAAFRPAGSGEEIGGDFYDVFPTSPDDWVVTIGDVQGKGVEAAVVATLVRHTIRDAAVQQASGELTGEQGRPTAASEVLRAANEALVGHETRRFCTAALLRLRRTGSTWRAQVASAGHPLPLLTRPGADPRALGRPGPLLGIFADAVAHDHHVTLHPGDTVVLYTDGVTEARRDPDWFGEARLLAAIARHGPLAGPLAAGVLDDVLTFQGGFPRDDIAVLAVAMPPDR